MLTLVNGHALKSLPNTIQSLNELEVGLKLQGHPNIVKIVNHQILEKKILIEMELVPSNLLELSRRHPYGVPLPLLRSIAIQMVAALRHIHQNGFIHQDLKLENVLIDDSGRIYLIDFEYAIPYDPNGNSFTATAGSIHYLSPEAIRNLPCVGPEIDIWSTGVTLFILATGSFPFHGRTIEEVWASVANGIQLEGKDPSSLDNLFSQMLQSDHTKRITVAQLEEHPWLNSHPAGLVSPPSAVTPIRRASASFHTVTSSKKNLSPSSDRHSSALKHSASDNSPLPTLHTSSTLHASSSKKSEKSHSRRRRQRTNAKIVVEPGPTPPIQPADDSITDTTAGTSLTSRKKHRKISRSFKPLFCSRARIGFASSI